MYFEWDSEKNKKLLAERNVSFEECVALIKQGEILAVEQNKVPREHQRLFILSMHSYTYVVPAVISDDKVFLKTIYPSSKYHKKYNP